MPHMVFDKVTKSFGQIHALRDFSVAVEDGEFLVLLGPSGCGKSTLLRMIAGLTDVTSGTISFDGEVINDWAVQQRKVAFVFQSYALYPQMSVEQNIAFPLLMDRLHLWQHIPIVSWLARRRLMRMPEVRDTIDAIAAQLQLVELLHRRPAKLSGGQRQRVALARALVREPAVYLLDEPLSNLDAKLRTQMRVDLTTLHRSVGKTFVYVTHDQVEAMTMATTIIVMNEGQIQQVGTPDEIYDHPQNTFVASFVGSPPMNLIDGARFLGVSENLAFDAVPSDETLTGSIVGVRPEKLRLVAAGEVGLPATIDVVERVGAETLIGCRLDGEASAEDGSLVFARVESGTPHRPGERCSLRPDPESISWFDSTTGERIEPTSAVLFGEASQSIGMGWNAGP
jgi:multiple sugar transport system ATP-binding protein